MAVETIFQRADLSAPALINPTDTTEKIKDFPKIRYKNTEIAFFQSRVGAPACVVGFEEAVAMGAEQFVLFGSCGVPVSYTHLDVYKRQGSKRRLVLK